MGFPAGVGNVPAGVGNVRARVGNVRAGGGNVRAGGGNVRAGIRGIRAGRRLFLFLDGLLDRSHLLVGLFQALLGCGQGRAGAIEAILVLVILIHRGKIAVIRVGHLALCGDQGGIGAILYSGYRSFIAVPHGFYLLIRRPHILIQGKLAAFPLGRQRAIVQYAQHISRLDRISHFHRDLHDGIP